MNGGWGRRRRRKRLDAENATGPLRAKFRPTPPRAADRTFRAAKLPQGEGRPAVAQRQETGGAWALVGLQPKKRHQFTSATASGCCHVPSMLAILWARVEKCTRATPLGGVRCLVKV